MKRRRGGGRTGTAHVALITLAATAGAALGLGYAAQRAAWPVPAPLLWLGCWLLAVNAVTLATYGYDKLIAGGVRTRVPERVLLGLAAAGGTPGALLAMRLFRHKTLKQPFRTWFLAIMMLQALALGALLAWHWHRHQG